MSLATWLAIAVSSVLAAVTLAQTAAAYLFGRAQIERGTMRTLEVIAEDRHAALVQRLEGSRSRAEQLLATLAWRCGPGDAACRRPLVENFVRINEAAAARLVATGPDGGLVSVGPEALIAELGRLAGPEPPAVAEVRHIQEGRYLAVRVGDGTSDLTLLFDEGYVGPVFESRFGLGEGGETFLADPRGYFVTPGRFATRQQVSHPIDARPMVACLDGAEGALIAPDYRGVMVIHGFRPVPEIGGGCIMAHIDYDEAMGPVRAFGRTLAGISVVGLALGVLVSMLMARLLAAPLWRLIARARALAAGDLDSPVPVEGPCELREYAHAFGEMACALRGRVDELDEARKELDAFNASVTHDLRGPLRAIEGFTAAVLEDAGDVLPATSADMLRRVLASARRMERLIEDLLALARVSRSEVARVPVDLTELALAAAAELPRDPERPVALDVAPGLEAQGDPGLLLILFANLLGNAWKFTARAPRPHVEVFAQDTGTERAFAVRDNGIGFDPAQASRLFVPFARLHGREFEGTGIGLATVARIVRRHGGRVWAEGAPGRGATFYFTLPRALAGAG